ncbi:FGGY-family carbohydrate kinase [Actinomadura viridis]|uniref:xylulokinase n=1 Tax=Actinomadura viridis TaxID=58110 RepID=UPI00368AC34C
MPEPPPGTVTIGVDVGTTGLKAVALDERARLVAEHAVRYPTRLAGTAAEQDAEVWWAAARTALSRVTAASGTRVTGVAVTGQAPTLVAVDRRGDPLGPALTWIDRRAMAEAREIGDLLGPVRNGPDPFFGTAKLLWWTRHRPAEIGRAAAVLHANGFLVGRLTGARTLDTSGACLMQGWDDGWPAALERHGVPVGLLPEAVPSLALVGEVTGEAAARTGLPAGTPVAAGGIDALGSALEAGLLAPGDPLAEMTGFSTVSMLAVPRGTHVPGLLHTRHCVDGVDLVLTAQVSSGAVVDWVRDLTGGAAELLESAPLLARPRPGRLLAVPSFAGERTPTWDARARGAVIGLDLATDARDLLLAVFEGTAFALRADLDLLERAGHPVPSVTCTGGGARSEAWLRIKADVLDRPIRVPVTGHGAAAGAAMMAGLATGVWSAPGELRDLTAATARTYRPDPARAALYAARFGLFQRLRETLPPLAGPLLPPPPDLGDHQ